MRARLLSPFYASVNELKIIQHQNWENIYEILHQLQENNEVRYQEIEKYFQKNFDEINRVQQEVLSQDLDRLQKLAEELQGYNNVKFMAIQELLKCDFEELKSEIQILLRLYGSSYLITTTKELPHNFMWVTQRGAQDIVSKFIQQGFCGETTWDYAGLQIYNMLPSSGVILDLGANVGAFIFPLVKEGWSGYAVEASSVNADLLRKTIALNDFDVHVCEKAVFESTGKAYFFQDGPQGYLRDRIHDNMKYEEVDTIALDDYLHDPVLKNITSIDFIKMDIEGSEPAAVRGMKTFLREMHYPPIYSEVNVWNLFCAGESQRKYFEQLAELGYEPYSLRDGALYKVPIDFMPEIPTTDYFFLQSDDPLCRYIRGELKQNVDEMLRFSIQVLKDLDIYLKLGKTEELPILPHIALYKYIQEYPVFANNEDIIRLRKVIADQLCNTTLPVFQKMLEE